MLRRHGLGSFRDLLVELAKNPAMIFWLDNNGNHRGAINENWGRELLELFSMGVGNYSEDDIKEASRAFTGWTIGPSSHACPWAVSTGALRISPRITTTVRRLSWVIGGALTAKISLTSLCSSRPPQSSWRATCTTSSWLTSPRCRAGTSRRQGPGGDPDAGAGVYRVAL